jgi:hypothetical protein
MNKRKKMNALLSPLRREKAKIKRSQGTGKGMCKYSVTIPIVKKHINFYKFILFPFLRRTTTRLVERHYVRAHDTRRCSVAPQPQEHRIFDA